MQFIIHSVKIIISFPTLDHQIGRFRGTRGGARVSTTNFVQNRYVCWDLGMGDYPEVTLVYYFIYLPKLDPLALKTGRRVNVHQSGFPLSRLFSGSAIFKSILLSRV